MKRYPLVLRAAQSAAVRGSVATLAEENMTDPAPIVAVLGDPERCRFFARLDEQLQPFVDVDILVSPAHDDWQHLKSIPAQWLVLSADVEAVVEAAINGVEIPDDTSGLL